MGLAAANMLVMVCTVLATSIPFGNAFPMTPYHHNLVFFQQSRTISAVTEALAGALKDVIDDAKQSIKTDIKSALADLLRDKINSFASFGAINFDENHVELTVEPSSDLDLFRLFPFSSQVALPPIPLKRVTYTFATTELEVTTRRFGTQTIIPDIMQLNNIVLSLVSQLNDLSTLVVTFTGNFVVGGATIPVTATYTHASRDVAISAEVPSITINLQTVASELVGLNLPRALHASISIPAFSLSGMVASSGENQLIISATGGNIHTYIIYKKTDTARKAIAVELANIGFASVLIDVTGLNIADIPYFGTAVIPTIALTYATKSLGNLPEDIFANSPLLNSLGSSVEADLTALVKFGSSEHVIKLRYSGGFPTFQPATPGSLDVNSLISAIPSFDLSSIPLPPGVSGLLQLSIDTFALDLKAKSIKISVSYPGTLSFFDGFLTVENPMLSIEGPSGIKIEVDGDLSISGSGFDISIKRDEQSGKYILSATAKKLPISNLINQLRSEVLPSELNSLINSLPFFSFSINNPSLSFPLSTTPLQIQLGGTPVIAGYSTVYMSSVIIRQGGKTSLVQGFELGSLNLASFLKTITGFNFNSIAILNLEVQAAILISPVTLPNIHLTGEKLSGYSITKGLSFQASMGFPPGCSSDAFCAVAQFLLGKNVQLNVQGTIASLTSFRLFAGVSNLKLGGGVVMSKAGVEIQGGTTNSVGIVGSVNLGNPDIILAGRVFLSTSRVVLEMTMTGCWENAFGASWLDICSLQGSVGMIPGVTLTSLAFGGEVHIGDESCGTPLVATGFVGIDVVTPTNNYYYVNIQGSTTVGTVFNAFCINIAVPAPLAQSGFPHGFISSFSLAGVELPHVPLSIPQGYRFNGTLNILGLEGSADVTIGLPNGIDFNVALPPINVGGLLRMYASSSDQSRGPYLTADVNLLPTPSVNIEARGYLSVLGITLETVLSITNTDYIFDIQGRMLNLFDAHLRITASYGNIQQATFQVQGSFTNQLYDQIETLIKNGLNSAGNAASSAINAAKDKVNQAKGGLDSADSALRAGEDKVREAQSKFNSAAGEVNNVRNRLNSVCSIKSCGSVCIGCPGGLTCCGTAWGTCICKRPTWNSCCKRVTDPTCLAQNAACYALKKPIEAALVAAEETVKAASKALDGAKAALIPLRAAVTAAKGVLTAAEAALSGVEAAQAVGLRAFNDIARLGLNGLVSIREIRFNARLDVAAGGSFSGSVRAVFLGAAETTVSVNVNLHDITAMARKLADHIGNGFSSLF